MMTNSYTDFQILEAAAIALDTDWPDWPKANYDTLRKLSVLVAESRAFPSLNAGDIYMAAIRSVRRDWDGNVLPAMAVLLRNLGALPVGRVT